MDFAQEVGQQIKEAREARGWSQAELAKRCGVQNAHICRIEADIRHASMRVFLNICTAFGYDLRLLNETGGSVIRIAKNSWELLENINRKNVLKYMEELGKPVEERTLPFAETGRALDSVTEFILRGLNIDYSNGTQEYDYLLNIDGRITLISWKMGNLEDDRYRKNLLGEVRRAFKQTRAHEFIVTIPDHPQIAEEMNNRKYRKNLVFVPINSLKNYLQRYRGE
jgi:transcriptional regulator with XRE-family HTH domain